MERSEEQARRNEEVFRDANERIAERREELVAAEDATPFLCECEDEACTAIMRVPPDACTLTIHTPRDAAAATAVATVFGMS